MLRGVTGRSTATQVLLNAIVACPAALPGVEQDVLAVTAVGSVAQIQTHQRQVQRTACQPAAHSTGPHAASILSAGLLALHAMCMQLLLAGRTMLMCKRRYRPTRTVQLSRPVRPSIQLAGSPAWRVCMPTTRTAPLRAAETQSAH